MVQVSLGRPCAPYIYVVDTIYDSSSLRRWVSCPTLNLTIFSVIVFLTVLLLISSNLMRYHRCFSEEHFSDGKIIFRYLWIEVFGTPFFLGLRRSLTSGGFFLQLIDGAPNPCNVLYLTEVIDFPWPIYISVADCPFQPEEWPVVLRWIPVLWWSSGLIYMEPCKTKKLGVGTYFSPRWPLQHSAHYCYHLSLLI